MYGHGIFFTNPWNSNKACICNLDSSLRKRYTLAVLIDDSRTKLKRLEWEGRRAKNKTTRLWTSELRNDAYGFNWIYFRLCDSICEYYGVSNGSNLGRYVLNFFLSIFERTFVGYVAEKCLPEVMKNIILLLQNSKMSNNSSIFYWNKVSYPA